MTLRILSLFFLGIYAFLFCKCIEVFDLSEEEIEQKIFQEINNYRLAKGLNELVWNEGVAEQCRIHSGNMADKTIEFSHDGFTGRIAIIKKTMTVTNAGENIAYNQGYDDPIKKALDDWLNRIEHRGNIEGRYNVTGIGVKKNLDNVYYFTQIFILNE